MFGNRSQQKGLLEQPGQTLLAAPVGERLRLLELQGQPALCQRLREMGLCESAEIVKVRQGAAILCQVCGTRVALSHDLAEAIVIQPVAAGR